MVKFLSTYSCRKMLHKNKVGKKYKSYNCFDKMG